MKPESLSFYHDVLSKFEATIEALNRKVEDGKQRLRMSAKNGDVIERQSPKLTPMQERYLVIRLLEELDARRIPEADNKLAAVALKSYNSPEVHDKFRNEIPELFKDSLHSKSIKGDSHRKMFEHVRDGVQCDFQQITSRRRSTGTQISNWRS